VTDIFSKKKLSLLTLLLSLTGCVGEYPSHNLTDAPKGTTPELLLAPRLPAYRMQVGDVLDVKLMLNPELNDQVVVRPDGKISTIVTGDISAYGRTVHEVQRDLERSYGQHLAHPHVSLVVRSFAPTRIYVLGEVYNPGEFITVGPTLTMLQAVARAGGVKNDADTDDIVIVRHGAGESSQAYKASYHSAVTGKDPASDVRLAPYDIVYVPRTGVGNAYLNYQQNIQQFLPISGNIGADYILNNSSIVK
jgi:polysaccharide export outer membrane protein